jgi:hypothetical protein
MLRRIHVFVAFRHIDRHRAASVVGSGSCQFRAELYANRAYSAIVYACWVMSRFEFRLSIHGKPF